MKGGEISMKMRPLDLRCFIFYILLLSLSQPILPLNFLVVLCSLGENYVAAKIACRAGGHLPSFE